MNRAVWSLLLLLVCAPLVLAAHAPGHVGTAPGQVLVDYVTTVGRVSSEYELTVMGTDYAPGEEAKVFIQLTDNGLVGQPILNATCFVRVWFPNDTILINNVFMTPLDDGIYQHNFVVPQTIGVYPVGVKCSFESVISNSTPSSFFGETGQHNNPLSEIQVKDGAFFSIKETGGSLRGTTTFFNFTNVSTPVTPDSISVLVTSKRERVISGQGDPDNDTINIFLRNFSSVNLSWVRIGTDFDYLASNVDRTYTFIGPAVTDFILNGTVSLKANDTLLNGLDPGNTDWDVDFLQLFITGTSGNITQNLVRGGGELNVKNLLFVNGTVVAGSVPIEGFGIDVSLVLLVVWLVLLVVVVGADRAYLSLAYGLLSVLVGLSVIVGSSFWFGLFIGGIGLVVAGRGFSQVNP